MNSLRIKTTGSSSLDTLQYPVDSAMQAECIMQSFQNASVCALLCVSCITPLLKAVIYIFKPELFNITFPSVMCYVKRHFMYQKC